MDPGSPHLPEPQYGSRQTVSCELVCMNHSVPVLCLIFIPRTGPLDYFGLKHLSMLPAQIPTEGWGWGSAVDCLLDLCKHPVFEPQHQQTKPTSNSTGRRSSLVWAQEWACLMTAPGGGGIPQSIPSGQMEGSYTNTHLYVFV